MTEVRRKYKVVHVHYVERTGTVLLCLEPLDKLPRTMPFMVPGGSEEEKVVGKMAQATVKALEGIVPGGYPEERPLEVKMTLEDYEKLGRPGILDEVTLTLEMIKETT